ncbi:MAG: DszC-like desulfurization enzyme [Pseudomonadota bacterium]
MTQHSPIKIAARPLQPPVSTDYLRARSLFDRPHTPLEKKWLAVAREVSAEFAVKANEGYRTRRRPTEEIARLKASGLTTLTIPEVHGGGGGDWRLVVEVIREIAAGNGSLGVLLTHHYFGIEGLSGLPEPARTAAYKDAVETKYFRGVIANPRDPEIIATPIGNGKFALNGRKTFCTGAAFADIIGSQVRRADTRQYVLAVLKPPLEGLTHHGDWDAMGLAQGDSGTFTLKDVIVDEKDLKAFGPPPVGDETPEPSLGPLGVPSGNLAFSNVYLGVAIGALRAARNYIQTETRPWILSKAERAADDDLIINGYGELWLQLEAALAVANHAAEQVQIAKNTPIADMTEDQLGELRVVVATLKVAATKASVDITSKIFELMGARSSANKYGFDRFWRDARTYTLHSPVFYKVRELGQWGLNGTYPPSTFYT